MLWIPTKQEKNTSVSRRYKADHLFDLITSKQENNEKGNGGDLLMKSLARKFDSDALLKEQEAAVKRESIAISRVRQGMELLNEWNESNQGVSPPMSIKNLCNGKAP